MNQALHDSHYKIRGSSDEYEAALQTPFTARSAGGRHTEFLEQRAFLRDLEAFIS